MKKHLRQEREQALEGGEKIKEGDNLIYSFIQNRNI